MELKITVLLNPVSKKNSQQIVRAGSRTLIVPSKKYKQYERDSALFIRYNGKPIDQPCEVKCLFYMQTRRRCDLTNLLEAADDMLVKHGVLADDNFNVIQSHDGSRILFDKENPRTEIYIKTIGGTQ